MDVYVAKLPALFKKFYKLCCESGLGVHGMLTAWKIQYYSEQLPDTVYFVHIYSICSVKSSVV